MTTVVLDASVVFKWFTRQPESGLEEARALRARFETGDLDVAVPHIVVSEVLNVVARKWSWPSDEVAEIAEVLDALPWRFVAVPARDVARWVAAGLTPFDATYVALAEALRCPAVTDDGNMLRVAPGLASRLG